MTRQSIMAQHPRGSGAQSDSGQKPVVEFSISDDSDIDLWKDYAIVVLSVDIAEATLGSCQSTLGDSVYYYATGKAPVRITVGGTIIYPGCSEGAAPRFRDFYRKYQVSNYKKCLKLLYDRQAYWAVLTDYSRKTVSGDSDADVFSMTFVGVPSES